MFSQIYFFNLYLNATINSSFWQKHSLKESAKNLLTLVTESISPDSKTLLAYYQSNNFESKKR
jgi:hypothetical protein